MPSKEKHSSDELLQHIPEYGIVVCRGCSFAVQPKALASHLLRHQIYRNERRNLLNQLSRLGLLDPDDVPVPGPTTAPLPYLPLHHGYNCLAPGCSHSCVSQKRMFQHWSEAHDEHDSKNVRARPAALQTFFRGNKIRYFEVDGSHLTPTPKSGPSIHSGDDRSPVGFQQLVSPPSSTGDESERESDTAPTLDMQALRYFRHYTVSPNLIPTRGQKESESFWAETIYEEAFKHQFLMYGILGIAATHLAAEAADKETCLAHREAAIQYQSAGMTIFRAVMKHPDTTNSAALIAYARYIGLQRLMLQQLEKKYSFSASCLRSLNNLSYVTEMFFMLRGGAELLLGLQHLLPHGSDFILSEEDVDSLRPSDNIVVIKKDVEKSMHVPTALFNRLDTLPQRLCDLIVLQDPTESQAITEAGLALLASASRSYSPGGVGSLWNGLETFTQSVPDYYIRMLEAYRPAALVVFAHWCPLLLRLEPHYYCLRGQSTRMLKIIRASLPPELVPLVADLEHVIETR